jgi:hypothetical protein
VYPLCSTGVVDVAPEALLRGALYPEEWPPAKAGKANSAVIASAAKIAVFMMIPADSQ